MAANGSRVARVPCIGVITRYDGCREVTSLPVCPTDDWDVHDNGSRRAKIIQRNKIYLQALQKGSLHVHYDGPDLSDGRHYSGKVVIDHSRAWNLDGEVSPHTPVFDQVQDFSKKFAAYDRIFIINDRAKRLTKRGKMPAATTTADLWSSAATAGATASVGAGDFTVDWEETDEDNQFNTLTDHQLLLLQPEALAFALSAKDWMYISMDYVRPLQSSPDSIDNLVLVDPHALETIQALSMKQTSASRSWSADFIEGKGTGQIILLHGPPGVGKTYTVESIAAWLQRPLLALTVADIGTKEVKVEQELLKWFDIAESWNAVLLVDEADIFLEQRKTRDLARNGLVSAFLRRMEYFSGLLFLTTNRVGQIDDAFMSRIHVAIGYEGLTPEARRKIWSGFFKKLKKEKGDKVYVGKNAQEYVLDSEEVRKIDLNGREIRNALQTALTLAEYDTVGENKDFVIIEEGHFKKVLGMADKFHKYVGSIRRENEAKRAQGRGDRNDFPTDDNS
ncbi:hypothetical protein WHR41_07280 [Cladosporium halotolerans]|uniref:AAA+ ATPase domain-containing protein n=1 Tax=Cladosporium halotolerans TaxID=1052096 RepID=A0AB34KJD2_9PEZI